MGGLFRPEAPGGVEKKEGEGAAGDEFGNFLDEKSAGDGTDDAGEGAGDGDFPIHGVQFPVSERAGEGDRDDEGEGGADSDVVGHAAEESEGRDDEGPAADAEAAGGEAGEKSNQSIERGAREHGRDNPHGEMSWQAGTEGWSAGLPKGAESPYLTSSMQKHLSIGLSLLLAGLMVGCAVKDPKDPRFVVAEGKGIKITRGQLDGEVDRALLNFNLAREKVPAAQLNSLEMNILNQMINRQVALAEARKAPLTNAAVLAKEQLEKMKKNFPDAKAFEEQLTKAKTTEAAMVQEIEQKLEVDHLMRMRVEPTLQAPSDEDVAKFYGENPKLWQRNETVQAQHVLVKVEATADAATKAAKKKAAEAALARVNKGEAFEKVAQEVSDDPGSKARGGELPPFSKGQMTPNFEKVAFATAAGKTSAVFETPFGFHFLKVKAKEAAKNLKLEDVKNEILSHLKRLKQGEATRLLLEDLRKDAAVKILLPPPPAPAPVTATTPPVSAPPVPPTAPAPAKK